eukprot:TRINITY_DN3155_c0_g1_i3.p1 TRINITY_DN3155_c0_g1~~TRINITY_DN3155_c0_g1_i3.p1  ORF type:complete len:105 (-),score=12.04 TRINITY_DN3155_c0_g1_i3:175-489(-)
MQHLDDTRRRYATLTVDTFPRQSSEVRDQSGDFSFATFGVDDEFDERIMYDGAFTPYTSGHGAKDGDFPDNWPSRDAKFLATRGSEHRRDSVISHGQEASEPSN